jgi:hypothetical protein
MCVIRGNARVFTWAKEKIKCDGDEVGNSFMIVCILWIEGLLEDEGDGDNGYRLCMGRLGVFLPVSEELTGYTKVNGPEGLLPDVRGPVG